MSGMSYAYFDGFFLLFGGGMLLERGIFLKEGGRRADEEGEKVADEVLHTGRLRTTCLGA